MDVHSSVRRLLKDIGPGRMISVAYDTAWVARLAELDEPMGERALEWLREHQLPDGSWGAREPRYHHDRLVCTLAAVTALGRRGQVRDRPLLRRAQNALEAAIEGLGSDPAGETIGFEMLAPMLLAEAEELDVIQRWDNDFMRRLMHRRTAKLQALSREMVSSSVTASFSAEMAGSSGRRLLDIDNLQEKDGSVGHSPSATAYFVRHVRRRDPAALEYLRAVAARDEGGVPNVSPFDVFERAWVLRNLALVQRLDDEVVALCQPHLDFLQQEWMPGRGIGWASGYEPRDADDSAVTYGALLSFGRSVDVDALLQYERDDHFLCYPLEFNPSVSAQVHMLNALRQAGLEVHHPSVHKALRFLRRRRGQGPCWFDKWHASPYYTTCYAVVACAGYDDEVVRDAVRWIVETQSADGSWGYYMPTSEETAYCLQALAIWKRHGGRVPGRVLKRGADWLVDRAEPPYPPLWIGKCLYSPVLVVRSAVLSALMLVEQEA